MTSFVLDKPSQFRPPPPVALSSASVTAPGVTHRSTTLEAFTQEIASSRIWAGFRCRFSTVVGTDMGGKIGTYVATTALAPIK